MVLPIRLLYERRVKMGQGFPGCMSKWLRSATGMNNDDINAKKI